MRASLNHPLRYPQVKYHAQRSYAPVIALAHSPVVVVAKPDAPFNTMAQWLSYAKANPGKPSYADCASVIKSANI